MKRLLDSRPHVVAIAGPNGAGKTTFYCAHLKPAGLRFVNADEFAKEIGINAYRAATTADQIRRRLVEQRENFIFETVFSDPVGDKVKFLKEAEALGYTIVLVFIGIDSPATSEERVSMRVAKGGHDVPAEKIATRYARTMENLRRALIELKNVRVYDNSDLADPYRLVAVREEGKPIEISSPVPEWLQPLLLTQ